MGAQRAQALNVLVPPAGPPPSAAPSPAASPAAAAPAAAVDLEAALLGAVDAEPYGPGCMLVAKGGGGGYPIGGSSDDGGSPPGLPTDGAGLLDADFSAGTGRWSGRAWLAAADVGTLS